MLTRHGCRVYTGVSAGYPALKPTWWAVLALLRKSVTFAEVAMRILDHPYWARLREKLFGVSVVPAKPTVTYCPPGVAEGAYTSWASVGRGTDPVKYLG